MEVVKVEFAVENERLNACQVAVDKLIPKYSAQQPAFHSARLCEDEYCAAL